MPGLLTFQTNSVRHQNITLKKCGVRRMRYAVKKTLFKHFKRLFQKTGGCKTLGKRKTTLTSLFLHDHSHGHSHYIGNYSFGWVGHEVGHWFSLGAGHWVSHEFGHVVGHEVSHQVCHGVGHKSGLWGQTKTTRSVMMSTIGAVMGLVMWSIMMSVNAIVFKF